MRFSSVLLLVAAVVAVACLAISPAIACSGGSCSSEHGGIGGPMYNPNWAVGFRGARDHDGPLKGILAKLRERLHPSSSSSCGEASCGVEASCAAAEPSCGCAASSAPTSSNDTPTDPIARHIGHAAPVYVRQLAPEPELNPSSVATMRQ